MNYPAQLDRIAAEFSHPLVFATISGAHLYGFPSPDSDFDLRGCHILPASEFLGLDEPNQTEERLGPDDDIELDLVSHDLRKFCRMLLRPNGYVLEQLLSPHIVVTSPEHAELRALTPRLITRHHAHHYLGFARNQQQKFEGDRRVKSLLYVYRVLLTGIHLMRTGELQPSLPELLRTNPQAGVEDLIAAKTTGAERQTVDDALWKPHAGSFERLVAELESARESTDLQENTDAGPELNDLVVRIRRAHLDG